MTWKLADAKNRFSEVVRRALDGEPQRIERRNDAVVVVDAAEFERMCGEKPSFKEFLFSGPDLSELDLERDQAPLRDLDL
jgi:prevent-host-death family protein